MTIPDFPANAPGAPCKSKPPELFFPSQQAGDKRVEQAKSVCRRCPLVDTCLDYALHQKVEGVWGATTMRERDEMRAVRGIKAESLSFGPGQTNGTAIRRMYRQGRSIAHIAERMDLSFEAVRLVVRADEERRTEQGLPILPDREEPIPCADCGKKLLPGSMPKHRRSYCAGAEVAS